MLQSASVIRHRKEAKAKQALSPGKAVLGCLLGLAACYAAAARDSSEIHIVSLRDIDTAIILALPAMDARLENVVVIAVPEEPAPRIAVALPAEEPPIRPAMALSEVRNVDLPVIEALLNTRPTFVGIASTYNPFEKRGAAVAATASGEAYDPDAWTAAIQIGLRHDFGGVRFGRLYRATFALVERGDKRAIVRINDVGPLRPGRVIDLNARSMRYFDPSLRLGLMRDMKITILPGNEWTPGPVQPGAAIGLASTL